MTDNKNTDPKDKEDDDDGKIKPKKQLKKTIQEKFDVSDKCHIIMES